jgi:hypothetical protein
MTTKGVRITQEFTSGRIQGLLAPRCVRLPAACRDLAIFRRGPRVRTPSPDPQRVNVISVLQERLKAGADVPVYVSTGQQSFGRELLGRIISADMVKIWMCAQYPGEIFIITPRFPYL